MDAEELTGSLKKLVMWYKVKELKSKGLNKTQIARCLGINRNTVRKYQSMSESEFMNSQSYRRNYNHNWTRMRILYIRVWTLILICRVARYETGYVNSMKTSPM